MLRLLVALSLLASAAAQTGLTLQQLEGELPGHIIALRVPSKGAEIFFAVDGKPVPPILHGTFGRDGLITVDSVKPDDNGNLIIRGHRAILISFEGEPLHPLTTTEKVKVGIVVATMQPEDLAGALGRALISAGEQETAFTSYNLALRQSGRLGPDRDVVTDCRLTPIATPVALQFFGKKLYARVVVNEYGEPDAVFFTRPIRKRSDKEALLGTLWNWRFAPLRRNGKLIACSHELTIDATQAHPQRRMR